MLNKYVLNRWVLVAYLWTLCNSMELSRQEYWSGLPFPLQGSSQPRDWTQVSSITGRFFTIWEWVNEWKHKWPNVAIKMKMYYFRTHFIILSSRCWVKHGTFMCCMSIHPIRVWLFLSSWDTAVTLNLPLSFYIDIKCCLRWDIL